MLVLEVTVVLFVCLGRIASEDLVCAINGRKSLNTVDDRFLSLSIDPAALITGININYTSLVLAQHLNPSYVRIAGPSTEFLAFSKENDAGAGLTVTASMWQSMNDWFTMANLTPIFAINDNAKINGAWNPKPFYPLLDLSDKLGLQCLWQLGFDSSCKTLPQYKEDLLTLKHIIDTFPSKKKTWEVVGSDISGYAYNISTTKHSINTLRGQVNHFMYENASLQNGADFPDMSMRSRLLPKGRFQVWTTAPKSQHAVTFASALEWARQIGDAAKSGYSVVFRQPRLHEFFVDTPSYWVSLLHKRLMGRKVLEVKFSQEKKRDFHAYVHCTRKQNDFSKLGAITVMVVNNQTVPNALAVRIGTGNTKKITIQSYILTTTHENSVNTFLNGKKLSMEMLEENEKPSFPPKLRRAHVSKFLSLPLPEKSIGFFVLPGARIPVCINEEYNMKLLMQEIREDQNVKFENEEDDDDYKLPSYQEETEPTHQDAQVDFKEIFKQIEEEIENDERYYKNSQYEIEMTTTEPLPPIVKDFKRETTQKRLFRPKKLFALDLLIDNEEMKSFLKEKLKARAAEKQQVLTSEEIDEEAERIAKRVNNAITRTKTRRTAKDTKKPLRDTRDINMDLVRTRADHQRPAHHFHHRLRNNEERGSFHLPKISSRRREEPSSHRHSSHRHSQSDLHVSPRFRHRSQSRTHNFRHSSLHSPHRSKDKRDSNEGMQDAMEFMAEEDALTPGVDDGFKRTSNLKNDALWEATRSQHPSEFDEDFEDGDLDFPFAIGNPMDYADGDDDYYEIEIYSDDPFMRRKRKTRSAQETNDKSTFDKYHFIFGKPVDPSKLHMNPRQKEHQLKLLRQRLARRKKLADVQKRIKPTSSTTTQKVPASAKRQKRSALELSLKARYKKYIPKTKHLKPWKPADILKLGKKKRSIDSSENKIDNAVTDTIKKSVKEESLKIPGVVPVSSNTARSTFSVGSSTTQTQTKSVQSEAESASDCMTNEECLSLALGTSLEPEELFKPGWIAKMYSKVTTFLTNLQRDILQMMIS